MHTRRIFAWLVAVPSMACGSSFDSGSASGPTDSYAATTTGAAGAGGASGQQPDGGGAGAGGGATTSAQTGGAGGALSSQGGGGSAAGGMGSAGQGGGSAGAGGTCQPTSCVIEDIQCGFIDDGCGHELDCSPYVRKVVADYDPVVVGGLDCPADHPRGWGCTLQPKHEQPKPDASHGDCIANTNTWHSNGWWLWCCTK